MSDTRAPWLEPLIVELRAAGDDAERLAEIFARLVAEVGPEEAGARWWAAFGASDASNT